MEQQPGGSTLGGQHIIKAMSSSSLKSAMTDDKNDSIKSEISQASLRLAAADGHKIISTVSSSAGSEVSSQPDYAPRVTLKRNDSLYSSSNNSDDIANWTTSGIELDAIKQAFPLPDKKANRVIRWLRWNFFSAYRKLFTFVLAANVAAMFALLMQLRSPTFQHASIYEAAASAAAINFCVAGLLRNEHVINLLYRIAMAFPHSAPLAIRRHAAKVYSYGGAHSGCGVSGTLWYIVYCIFLCLSYTASDPVETALAATTGLTLMLLLSMLIFAHPRIRARIHDYFEAIHRYGGWSAIISLWGQTIILNISAAYKSGQSFGYRLTISPSFWCLVIITTLLIYPWTRLRLRRVQVEVLSKHAARLRFDYADLESCMGVKLTDAPLKETHSFAAIPNHKDEHVRGYSVVVSNAGDWTNKIINNPPQYLFVKGGPTMGVLRVARLFQPVLVIATGSGIGPVLSMLNVYPGYPMRVLWSSRSPLETYGADIIKAVRRADPKAVMIDTAVSGRDSILGLAYSLYKSNECEAAVIISNPKVTQKVVYGLETRGIPAYGAIFDS